MWDMTSKVLWDSSRNLCSMEPTAGGSSISREQELYRSIQAVLPKEADNQQPTESLNRGMLRWTLHMKVENNPAGSLSLVWVLIKELEKAEKWDCRKHIIPLLHTLMYAIVQTAYIPDELYKRVYDFCKRLLTYPQPYCTVGISYTRQIKAERNIPGLMYQRRIIAEQRLKTGHYPLQERVFVLADPDVFSGSLVQFLSDNIETSSSLSTSDHMRSMVQHSIQATLGGDCHGPKLAQGLQDMDEKSFQEVLAKLEQCMSGEGGELRSLLQRLYSEIVADTDSEPDSSGPLQACPLPNPEMSFHLWTEKVDIWRELSKCLRSSSMSEQFSSIEENEDSEMDESTGDPSPRLSTLSNDSGIERDMPPGADLSTLSLQDSTSATGSEQSKSVQDPLRLHRRKGIKVKPSIRENMALMQETLEEHASFGGGGGSGGSGGTRGFPLQRRTGSNSMQNPFPKQQRQFTAKIVAMGDDRVLGRLAKAYYFFRKREARRLVLTMKVNLQFYYIPVCGAVTPTSSTKENPDQSKEIPCSLGSYLSMVDPWYNCNINSLGRMIPQMAKLTTSGNKKEPIVSDVISYYVRTGQQPVYFTIYMVKITFTGKKDPVEDVFLTHLEMDFPEVRPIAASVREKQKRNTGEVCRAVVTINYKKATLSGREHDREMSVRTSGAQISTIPSNEAEDLNCLTLTLNESPAKTKNNTVESKIRTNNIKISSQESESITITLDRDCQSAYEDVKSVEIFPCLDPGYCVQKTMRSKLNVGEDKDAGLSKYMSKGLPLPVNTFAGITN